MDTGAKLNIRHGISHEVQRALDYTYDVCKWLVGGGLLSDTNMPEPPDLTKAN